MCDFFDNFEDNFDNDEFMDEDSFEDEYDADTEMDEPFDDNAGHQDEEDEAESQDDDFPAKDAFFLGGAMGWAYSKGQEEMERQRLIQKSIREKIKRANQ